MRLQNKFALINEAWLSRVIILTVILLGIIPVAEPASAQVPYNYTWAAQGNGDQYITPYGIDVDENKNSYIAGQFRGSYQFGAVSLDNKDESNSDAFVAKLNADGDWIWASRASASPGRDNEARGIAVDSQGNTYITGHFSENIKFGDIDLTGSGSKDIFVAKLDSDGNCVWARRAGGSGADYGYGIVVDQQNNIYVTGSFNGTADFGKQVLASNNYSNIYVAKLDQDGNWVWVNTAGGSGFNNAGFAITAGLNNGIYVTGRYHGVTADFGSITVEGDDLNYYGFAACLNPDGHWLWVEPFLIISGDSQAITTDQYGNCFIAGHFRVIQHNDQNYYCNAYTDVFAAKLNTQGKWVRFIQSGTSGLSNQGMNIAHGIAVDEEGNAYVSGKHDGKIKFGEVTLEDAGGFLAKWDIIDGGWDWAKPAGKVSHAVAMDTQDQLYVTGQFKESAVFGNIKLENNQYDYAENVFVAKAEILNGSGGLPAGFPYFSYSKWAAEPVVSSTHNFKVKFNRQLNRVVVENDGSQAIYVRTANNEVVPVTLEFAGAKQDTIQVIQSNQYISGATYYLYIDAGKIYSSQATGGKQLPATIVMKFTVY